MRISRSTKYRFKKKKKKKFKKINKKKRSESVKFVLLKTTIQKHASSCDYPNNNHHSLTPISI